MRAGQVINGRYRLLGQAGSGGHAVVWHAKDEMLKRAVALKHARSPEAELSVHEAELLARVRAALRHGQPQGADAIFRCGNLEVDLSKRQVFKNGAEVKLTPIEYSLLRLLVTHAGKVLTHRQLLTEVWGEKAVSQSHYLRVHFAHLREKLEANPATPELILTEPAVGYRLVCK